MAKPRAETPEHPSCFGKSLWPRTSNGTSIGAMYTPKLDLICNRVQRPGGASVEHRWGQRFNVGAQVGLQATSWYAPRRACLRNISASGALLELEPSLPPLKCIDVEIALCRRGRIDLIRIRACVVRKADHGVGVEWCEPLPLAVDELVEYATDVMTPPSRATGSAMGAAR